MRIAPAEHPGSTAFWRWLWLSLLVAAAVIFLLVPHEAKANVNCQADQPALEFGTALTGRGTISWNCTNFDATPVSFTLCAAVGTPSFPGTVDQPKLIGPAPTPVDFNVYTDSGGSQLWNSNNPLTMTVAIAGNGRTSGTFTFYGRIAPGQAVTAGSYSAFFYNTVVGFLASGTTSCQRNAADLFGVDVTISVTANVVEGCTLGTIGDIDFGELAGLQERIDAAGSVQLVCPLGRGWTLSFDGGRHASGGERRMQRAEGDLIAYGLYRDSSRSSPIEIDGALSGTGTGGVDTVPVYGRVEIGDLPPTGQYSDFIVVTLGF
ncbi:spore coat U domain-containing protein [Sphingomonas sp. 3-13AW]|jgi:spore coat protein U-like protein|uniref:Csu type fimbrial protein n=1 Tax=Sphingomonas sp. 3-13AW TaxID=3050450 RepID=UPI003BB55AD4